MPTSAFTAKKIFPAKRNGVFLSNPTALPTDVRIVTGVAITLYFAGLAERYLFDRAPFLRQGSRVG